MTFGQYAVFNIILFAILSVVLIILDYMDRLKAAKETKSFEEYVEELEKICSRSGNGDISRSSYATIYLLVADDQEEPEQREYWIKRAINCTRMAEREASNE